MVEKYEWNSSTNPSRQNKAVEMLPVESWSFLALAPATINTSRLSVRRILRTLSVGSTCNHFHRICTVIPGCQHSLLMETHYGCEHMSFFFPNCGLKTTPGCRWDLEHQVHLSRALLEIDSWYSLLYQPVLLGCAKSSFLLRKLGSWDFGSYGSSSMHANRIQTITSLHWRGKNGKEIGRIISLWLYCLCPSV